MAEKVKWDKSTGIAAGVGLEERNPGEPVPLTDKQKAVMLERIHAATTALKPLKDHFRQAYLWVFLVDSWTIMQFSPYTPDVDYCCTFKGLARFIQRKDAEDSEDAEDEEDA